ncbi:MAG: hypothetical protein IOC86_07190 [Aestuariivirga sp.]|nr:hypothetical protein [Aestuariivirga sp.]
MTNAKLHINLHQGLIEAEGEEAFVMRVYSDFRELLGKSTEHQKLEEPEDQAEEKIPPQRRRTARRQSKPNVPAAVKNGNGKFEPKLDKDLDTSELADYVSEFAPKNVKDRILVYASFMKDRLKTEPCTINHIYTCMIEMEDDIPTAFKQAFIDARGKDFGYIDYTKADDVRITIRGINQLKKLRSSKAEATAP